MITAYAVFSPRDVQLKVLTTAQSAFNALMRMSPGWYLEEVIESGLSQPIAGAVFKPNKADDRRTLAKRAMDEIDIPTTPEQVKTAHLALEELGYDIGPASTEQMEQFRKQLEAWSLSEGISQAE